ncbi:MAG: filamentous hemagglutinin N-terminal domain-containing protein [Gammaproteobacteria bacterium]|nr:filamentous hemagglutinin N-terminal domain-containing protein [Gammaproteobacteria bacterium]MDH5801726.1 filamentous hemagglutinin N-terminal domain-containing protein [Gammaproteobacteria bacterium]
MHKPKSQWFSKSIIISGALAAASGAQAEVVRNTESGAAAIDLNTNNEYNIEQSLGQTRGSNLFHSFQHFNVYADETANFQAGADINNIIARVTDSRSDIFGTVNAPANLFLLNSHGIVFGENATLNINGSFHASTADYLLMEDGTQVQTNAPVNSPLTSAPPAAFGFTGTNVAAITVNGETLTKTNPNSTDNGGTLSLVGGEINIEGSHVTTQNGHIQLASVTAGEVSTDISNIDMEDSSLTLGSININSNAAVDSSGASGGKIVIRGGQLIMDSAALVSNTDGSANESATDANIDIHTSDTIAMNHGASIQNNVTADANAGGIALLTATLTMDNSSHILSSDSDNSSGDTGNIDINATSAIEISGGSKIITSTLQEGNTGNITINSPDISITGPSVADDAIYLDFGGIYSRKSFTDSSGGNITIGSNESKNQSLKLSGLAEISTHNYSDSGDVAASDGGNIDIHTNNLKLEAGAQIYTLAMDDGNGGNISINAQDITLEGAYVNPNTALSTAIFTETKPSFIFTAGKAGDILIDSDNVSVLDGASIHTESYNSMNLGGKISIAFNSMKISGTNSELANFFETYGYSPYFINRNSSSNIYSINYFFLFPEFSMPGGLTLTGDELKLSDNGFISTENRYEGAGTDLNINVKFIDIIDGGNLTSTSPTASQNAGNIIIEAEDIYIKGNTTNKTGIFSGLNDEGDAGRIDITTDSLTLIDYATISSETIGPGNGGNISITSSRFVALKNKSSITAKSSSEVDSTGNAGNILLATRLLALSNSYITTTAVAGYGGNIDISANTLLQTSNSVISAASSQSVSGTVNINTKIDIGKKLDSPAYFQFETPTFRNHCNYNTSSNTFVQRSQFNFPAYEATHKPFTLNSSKFKNQHYTHLSPHTLLRKYTDCI